MKAPVFLTMMLLATSCSLFQKPSMSQKEIDTLVAENQALRKQLEAANELEDQLALSRMQLDEAMLKLSACEEAGSTGIHIIVGAFKIPENANAFANEVKARGMDGRILSGPYQFKLVTAGSFESVQSAFSSLMEIRENSIDKAWIYIE
ncbi:MAG: hypothetical protein CSA96_02155 [Bacteroidetes bacterium]|nr:MAG: hypothetical protein CSA96_02155 [Bacteroidota bacterium]